MLPEPQKTYDFVVEKDDDVTIRGTVKSATRKGDKVTIRLYGPATIEAHHEDVYWVDAAAA